MELKLWQHQTLAIEKAKQVENLALLFDVGTGKTATTINILRNIYNREKRILPTLIIGPLVVVRQWKAEFAKFSKVPPERIVLLNEAGKKRVRAFEEAHTRHKGNFIAVMNYEGLLIDGIYERLKEWGVEVLVCDESHRLKDHSTVRVKRLKPIALGARHRYILTGTPVLNSALDLYSQYLIMDGGRTFGSNYFAFRATYFYDKNAGMPRHRYFPNWQPKPDSSERLQAVLSSTSVQAKKQECIDLPPLVKVEIPIELGKEQARAYEEMKKQFITLVKDQVVTAQLAITQALRLRQILAGFIQDTGKPPIFFDENPRLEAAIDLITDLVGSGKVILWTDFVATYDQVAQALAKKGISSVFLTGQQTAKEKDQSIDEFTKGAAQVVICNPQAVSLGVNLIESKYSVYYSRSYSLEHQIQSEARNYRGGSAMHDRVTHYNLIAKETLDEVIAKCLEGKGNVAEALLDWANTS